MSRVSSRLKGLVSVDRTIRVMPCSAVRGTDENVLLRVPEGEDNEPLAINGVFDLATNPTCDHRGGEGGHHKVLFEQLVNTRTERFCDLTRIDNRGGVQVVFHAIDRRQ